MGMFFELLLAKAGTAPTPPTYKIDYTSTDGQIVTPYDTTAFGGATIVSNTYSGGVGTIGFDAPVTAIGYYAFHNCDTLASITIPDTVTSLGEYAFNGCSGLTDISIPNNVTSIGRNLLSGCTALSSVTIGTGITALPQNMIYRCRSLTALTIPVNIESIDNEAFNSSSLASISIHRSSSVIPYGGTLPSSVNHIYVVYYLVGAYKTTPSWSNYASKISAL